MSTTEIAKEGAFNTPEMGFRCTHEIEPSIKMKEAQVKKSEASTQKDIKREMIKNNLKKIKDNVR